MSAVRYILGVDGGTSGAWALLGSDSSLDVIDTPTEDILVSGQERARLCIPQAVAQMRIWPIDAVFFEEGREIPRVGEDGRKRAQSGMYPYGFCNGAQVGIAATLGLVYNIVDPSTWKRRLHLLGKDKEASRFKAIELFGATTSHCAFFRWKKDHNRAEAALIAYYGMLQLYEAEWHSPH